MNDPHSSDVTRTKYVEVWNESKERDDGMRTAPGIWGKLQLNNYSEFRLITQDEVCRNVFFSFCF